VNISPPITPRRVVRNLLVIGGLLAGVLMVAMASAALMLQTDSGRHWLANRLAAQASGPGSTVAIGALEFPSLFAVTVIDLTMADHKGRWLTAHRTHLRIDGNALLAGRLDVVELAVDRLDIDRPPLPLPEPAPPPPTTGGNSPPDTTVPDVSSAESPASAPVITGKAPPMVPALPLPITVQRVVVEEMALGAALLGGEPALLHAEGDAQLGEHRQPQRLDLDLSHRDGRPGGGHLHVGYAPATDRLLLDLAVAEPPGGVLARGLRLRDLPALDFKASGDAPLANWHGSLSATAGKRAALTIDANIHRATGGYQITLQGGGNLTALMPPSWAAAVGPAPRLTLDLLADDDGGLTLHPTSSLTLAAANLTTHGTLDPDTHQLTLDYQVTPTAEALVAAGLLPSGTHWQNANLSGTLTGPPANPTITAELHVEEPVSPDLSAHTLTATIRSTPRAVPATSGAMSERTLTLEAAMDYPNGADATIARLAGPHPQITVNAVASSNSDDIHLSKVAMSVAAGRLTGTGTASPTAGRLKATGHFTVDHLSRLLGPFGLPLSGVADLTLSLRASHADTRLDVSGTAGTLRTEIDRIDGALAAVLDDTLHVKGSITLDDRGGVHARDWLLEGHQFALGGQADLAHQRLEATLRADLPHLEPLAEPLGLPQLTGAGHVEASWHGPLATGAAKAALVISDLGLAGRTFGRSELTLAAADFPTNGHVQATLRALNGVTNLTPILATATLALATDSKAIEVDPLLIRQGDNRIDGTLHLAFDGVAAAGHLNGQWPDLANFAPFIGTPLTGRGRIDALLTRHDDQTSLRFAGGVNGLRLGGGPASPALTATALEFKGSVSGASFADLAKGRLSGSTALTGQGLKLGPTGLATLNATIDSNPSQTTFRVIIPPAPGQPTNATLAGTFNAVPEGFRLQLTQLAGQLGGLPLSLTTPAVFDISQTRLAISGLKIGGQDFHLDANGAIGAEGLSGHLTLSHLPLAPLRLLYPALPGRGQLDAEATLSGSLADPRADISAHVKDADLAQTEAVGLDLGTLGGDVQAHWRGDRLAAEGEIRTGSGANLHWHGDIPLVLRLAPLTIDLPKTAALHGTLSGGLELATFSDLLADRGDHLAGKLAVALSLGGTPAAPDLGGQVTISDGRYENQMLGGVIDHISAKLAGSDGTFTIEQVSGHTTDGGEVAATGTLKLTPLILASHDDPVFDIHVTARDARLVQIDPITANVDADLTLTGGLKAARLAGAIAIRRADIRLPDQLPSEVVDLKVIESHQKPVQPPATPPAPPAAAPPPPGTKPASAKPPRRPVLPGATIRVTAPPTLAIAPTAPAAPPWLTLALAVNAHSNVFVHGRGVDSEFSADLKITGSLPTPAIKGTLTMLNGRLDLLGKEFQFKHGTIEFAGGNALTPELDLLAEARTGSITAEATVTGSTQTPRLTLTSTPVMPQDEILARLLFDKSVSQLGGLEAVQLADSAAQLTGLGGSSTLVEHIRHSLGIDRLGVTTSAPGAKRETVEAGRYVTKDIYLGVQQGPTEDSSRAKVEMAITNTVQAEVDVGVHADPQMGLKFEWDY